MSIQIQLNEQQLRDSIKLYARIKRHGDSSIVMKRGRKPVSDEHKKETLEKQKAKILAEKIAHGLPIRKRGRPKKNSLSE
jgi:hypothetical protein